MPLPDSPTPETLIQQGWVGPQKLISKKPSQ